MNDEHLTQLGRSAALPASPDEAVLERVANPHPDSLYLARFAAPEFTSLCPVTGQPDFAHLVIDYAPAEWLIESKSLKLFLGSFRNHGAFHEDCTIGIGKRIVNFTRTVLGFLPGGLGIVTVASCLMFGGVSGSALADTAAILAGRAFC